jgi:alcohol dehydrogenase (cytochrome c)
MVMVGPPRPTGPAPSRGHSLVGDIKNYVPVTDAMLKNPPPGDWLMARRNYQAWSYSPLDEINRGNVKELKLAWSWSMNEAGANQAMPLIHNGIMYLGNTGNIMPGVRCRDRRAALGKTRLAPPPSAVSAP